MPILNKQYHRRYPLSSRRKFRIFSIKKYLRDLDGLCTAGWNGRKNGLEAHVIVNTNRYARQMRSVYKQKLRNLKRK